MTVVSHVFKQLLKQMLGLHLPIVLSAIATLLLSSPGIYSSAALALSVEEATELWTGSTHSQQNVNCSSCHQTEDSGEFVARPGLESCRECHEYSTETYLLGKHGIRMQEGLSPLTPDMARLPMSPDSHQLQMTCNTCHDVHAQDTLKAAVDACLTCHSDRHSLNYLASNHAKLSFGHEDLPRPGGG